MSGRVNVRYKTPYRERTLEELLGASKDVLFSFHNKKKSMAYIIIKKRFCNLKTKSH